MRARETRKAPAQKAPENRFNSHSVSTNISNNGREAPEGKINRAGRENCQSIVHGQRREDLAFTPLGPETTKLYTIEVQVSEVTSIWFNVKEKLECSNGIHDGKN